MNQETQIIETTPDETRQSPLDRAVRGIAAGIGPQELWAMLRGDPPTERPNARYKAHRNSMLLHLRPRAYATASTWFHHTFRLGWLAVFLFIVETITGIILMIYYVPHPDGAYESIHRIMNAVPFGEYVRDIHRLGAELMIIVGVLHMLRTFLTGSHRGIRTFTWITGVVLLILTLGLTFSGYLLPWDQLAYWAVTIGTSMAGAVPIVGQQLNLLLRGSAEIGVDGLLRFYMLHIIALPLLALVFLAIHYYRVARIHGISLPAWVEERKDVPVETKEKARRPIDFIPELLSHEMMWMVVGILALFAAVYFWYDAPLERHANPLHTPLESKAPWFFLWVQGLLKLGDIVVFGLVIPIALVLLLFVAPYLERGSKRMIRSRPIAVFAAFLIVIALAVLTYMGSPGYGLYIQPAVHIGQILAPEEGVGPLRNVPFDQLQVGFYEAGVTAPDELPPALARIFIEYEQMVKEAHKQEKLPNAQAWMIVEDHQANLKRVTLRIQWTVPDTEKNKTKTYERTVYIHRSHLGEEEPAIDDSLPESPAGEMEPTAEQTGEVTTVQPEGESTGEITTLEPDEEPTEEVSTPELVGDVSTPEPEGEPTS